MPEGLVAALVALVAVLGLVCAPVIYLRVRRGAEWRWFWLGVGSWAIAFVVKAVLTVPLDMSGLPAAARGLGSGFISGACELGMAALFLRRRALSVGNVLAFGTGIGAFEVLFVLLLGALEFLDTPAGDASLAAASVFFLIERAVTLVGHVASRVLIYVALQTRTWLPAVVALCVFTLVDGVAYYGDAVGWNWDDLRVRGSFQLFILAVGAIEAWAAWRFWRAAHSR